MPTDKVRIAGLFLTILLIISGVLVGGGPSPAFSPGGAGFQSVLDTDPPTTTIETSPASPGGDNDWFKNNPAITLSTSETAVTYYAWESTASVTTYTAPFNAPADGVHFLYFYSIDQANNTETVRSREFKVDTTAPQTTSNLTGTEGQNGWYTSDVEVALTATDNAGGSGVARTGDDSINEDFEDGNADGWTLSGNRWVPQIADSSTWADSRYVLIDGNYSLLVRGTYPGTIGHTENNTDDGIAYRDFIVPQESTLTFKTNTDIGDNSYDHIRVTLYDLDNSSAVIKQWDTGYSQGGLGGGAYDHGHGLAENSIDLSAYAGRNVRLYMRSHNGGWFAHGSIDSISFSSPSSSGGSGVTDTQHSFDNAIWNTYDSTLTIAAEGTTTVYYRSTDEAGNVEETNELAVALDTDAPLDPTISSNTHEVNQWSADNTIDLEIHPDATDTLSGVAGHSITFSSDSTEVPPQTIGTSDTPNATDTYTSTELADGVWYANLSTVDNAGNWTSTVHEGPFKIDKTAPQTSADLIGAEGQNGWYTSDVEVAFQASDGSGGATNEGFEDNNTDGWTLSGQNFPQIADSSTRIEGKEALIDGNYSLMVNGHYPGTIGHTENNTHNAVAYRDFVVPQESTLTFKTRTDIGSNSYDHIRVTLYDLDSNSAVIKQWDTGYSQGGLAGGAYGHGILELAENSIDLSEYAGRNVRLYLRAHNGGWFAYGSIDSISFSSPSSSGGSGVADTQYSFDNVVWSTYDSTLTITAEGTTTVYYRSMDLFGHIEEINQQVIKIDSDAPANPDIAHEPDKGSWSIYRRHNISLSGATDSISGLDGYSYNWSKGSSEAPDETIDSDPAQKRLTSPKLTKGSWYFNLKTRDKAGNWSTGVHYGPVEVDGATGLDIGTASAFSPVFVGFDKIAYVVEDPDTLQWDIWIMNLSGSGKTNLTNTPARDEYDLDYSPATGKLVFLSHAFYWDDEWGEFIFSPPDIWTMNLDGSERFNVTRSTTADEYSPVFSPNGREIAFVGWNVPNGAYEPPNDDIWLIRSDGSGRRNLTSSPFKDEYAPDLSPDGRIAFEAYNREAYSDIWLMNGDGSDPVNLTNSRYVDEFDPTFHPGGDHILFTVLDEWLGTVDLWMMRADGSGKAKLLGAPSLDEYGADFSPDGGSIVFESFDWDSIDWDSDEWPTSKFWIISDNQPPTAPKQAGSSHTKNQASRDNTIEFSLQQSIDTQSGLDGYSYRWSRGGTVAAPGLVNLKAEETLITSAKLADGDWYLNVSAVDRFGNRTKTQHFGPFIIDTSKPQISLTAPFVSSKISKTTTFKVKWTAEDPSPSSGLDFVRIYYRASGSASWRLWKTASGSGEAKFTGKAGRTYYFKALAVDKAHNWDWSKVYKTIIPFNEGIYRSKAGFFGYQKRGKSQNYLTSVRYSYVKGHSLTYKLYNNNGIGLIVTKSPNMGRAKIYLDGVYVRTVDAHSSTKKARQLIYYKGFAKKGTHWLKVVNLGTPGRAKFEVDGVVVGR